MEIKEILQKTEGQTWQEKLINISEIYTDIVFSSSFSLEDQIITDFIATNNLPIEIFTLDTGRLPKETYAVWQNTLDRYKVKISAYYPDQNNLESFIKEKGINPFYESVDLRKTCCAIRKIEPLQRALKGKKLWISGLRKDHSSSRLEKSFFEEDENLDIIKFYPLLEVSEAKLWDIINDKNIPFNRLYKSGYRSIGCDPCSRVIGPNDDIRAGRWWWENSQNKECGLHVNK